MALEPDNVGFPEGQSLYMEDIDGTLVLRFESRQDIRKMINIIDEVLEHIQVALKVME